MNPNDPRGPVHVFLADDHARLDGLLRESVSGPVIDTTAYEAFRSGLLRHISMEEKVLFPDARRRRGGEHIAIHRRLHADHGVLAALLVPTPTHDILAKVREVLDTHNALEEGVEGAYAECERLVGPEAAELLARIQAVPEVQVAPHFDGPRVHEHIANLLQRSVNRGSS